jgi:hypothetical protein
LLNKQFIADLILKFLYIQNLKLKNEGWDCDKLYTMLLVH